MVTVYQFTLPELGEGIHEGEIVKWHVKQNDSVEEDQIILEVQNDKAVVEVPSPVTGKVKEIVAVEGSVSVVGDTLVTFEVKEHQKTEEKHLPNELLATPSVRKLARELGIEIRQISGTGHGGRITKEDIYAVCEGKKSSNDEVIEKLTLDDEHNQYEEQEIKENHEFEQQNDLMLEKEQKEERITLKGTRKVIAEAMSCSKFTAPHVTLIEEVRVDELVQIRKDAKLVADSKEIKLTYLPFVIKAVLAGLKVYPQLNASLIDDDIILKYRYHIGVATDTEQGLYVPVIKNANTKNMWQIAQEIAALASKAREGKLHVDEMKGSTFTITNIGSSGGLYFTPIINYPEAAILGMGRIEEKPVIHNGQIEVGQVMALSLSFDHRIIDGATAQRFLNKVKALLYSPQLLIMEV